MKKIFFNLLAVVTLIFASGVTGSTQQLSTQIKRGDVTQNTQQKEFLIPVVIPEMVTVNMKKGDPKSGRLRAIDSKQITLFSGKNSTVMIADINNMVFNGRVQLLNGRNIVIVIRGEIQRPANKNQNIWEPPISNFKIKDYKKAEVNLASVTNPSQLKGIIDVLKNNSYVVKTIQFKPSDNKMTLQVETRR